MGVDVKVLGSVSFRMGWVGFWRDRLGRTAGSVSDPKKGAFTTIISNEPPPLGRAAAHL